MVWVVVVVMAIVVFAALVARWRREAGRAREAGPPREDVAPPEVPREEVEEVPEVRELRALEESRGAERATVAAAVEEAIPEPPKKPELSEKELRSRVEEGLAESERMLKELRAAAEHDEGLAQQAGMVAIIEEGLQEVRALADRKKWSQAKDKGDALRAQLSLMLRGARRERAR